MKTILLVGTGGFIGTIFRYLISQIPISTLFPFKTLCINVLGAILIGFISQTAKVSALLSPNTVAFLQVGICGGFTTFSTFSLETVKLFEKKNFGIGILYAIASVVLCLIGVYIGIFLANIFKDYFIN